MSHSITAKLNRAANEHAGQNGVTFFVGLGEKNYDFKLKTNVYTNYDAALFAKDAQIEFYRSALVEGAIVTVSGTGLILDLSNSQYPKLMIQDAKLGFVSSPQATQAPANQGQQQQQQQQQQAPQQQAPQQQQSGFANQGQQQAPRDSGGFTQAQGGFQQQQAPLNDNEPPF